MLPRRALAVTPDKDFAKALKLALMAAGTVADLATDLGALPSGQVNAAVCALHLPDNQIGAIAELGARLDDDAWIIVILGKSNLSDTVAAMQAFDRVAGVLVADRFSPQDLAAMVTRLLHGDIFGLDKVVPWGTRIYSMLVGDYHEKSLAINELSEFAAAVGVRRKYREALEQCADEMLMNALYDAPVGADGKQLFAEISTRERINVKVDQKAIVQYACDGTTFALSVRDAFGSFERATLLRYLHKCLHSDQQIDRKAGGAGLGLYLMANAATSLLYNLLPGVATECICVFDISAPKVQLKHIGVFDERVDAAGRLIEGPSRVSGVPVERRRGRAAPAAAPRSLMMALGSAIVLLAALIALVAYPRLTSHTGAIDVATTPTGAAIEVDGRLRGSTGTGPLHLADLDLGAHRVIARKDGFDPAETVVAASRDHTATVQLTLTARAATVQLESHPTGASVSFQGQELGRTPAALTTLPPGTDAELTLELPGYAATRRTIHVPAAGATAYVSVDLPLAGDLASVTMSTSPAGASIYQNGELLAGLATPVREHLVEADKSYHFTFKLPGYMPATADIKVKSGQRNVPVAVTLSRGGSLSLSANVGARASVVGTSCKSRSLPLDCALADGHYRVRVDGSDPYLHQSFDIDIKGGEVQRELRFGIVAAPEGFALAGGGKAVPRVALEEGNRPVVLISAAGGKRTTVTVAVKSGATVTAPAPASTPAPAPAP